jgi:hypothetical protein
VPITLPSLIILASAYSIMPIRLKLMPRPIVPTGLYLPAFEDIQF